MLQQKGASASVSEVLQQDGVLQNILLFGVVL